MVPTSFRSGRFETRTGDSERRAAANAGSAAFFAPATRISPESGAPPWMESFCLGFQAPEGAVSGQRAAHSSGDRVCMDSAWISSRIRSPSAA